jgi:tripartite-type tricarboxylate transporter receptor subunit TctC
MRTTRRLLAILVASTALAASVPAFAQSDKAPVRVIVGLAAGGTNDLIARELAERLRVITGEAHVVENKTGATQRVALGEVKRSAPDGRTLLLATNSPFSILPAVYGDKVGYDAVKDFTPIARVVKFDVGIAIGPKVANGQSFADYVAWCKANPQQASFGTPGAGTSSHFMGLMIGKAIGVKLAHVPYRGGTPAQADIIGGHLPMLINGLADMMENHKGGKLRVVAVTGEKRSPLLPDAPTLKELGIDIAADIAVDIYGPAGMAPDLVKKINANLVQAITSPEARARLSTYGVIIAPSTPEQLAAAQAAEMKMWLEPIRASGYTGE